MKYIYLLLAIAFIGLTACDSNKKSSTELLKTISNLEDSIFTKEGGINPLQDDNGRLLAQAYEDYAATDIPDSLATDALFKAAAVSKSVNKSYAKSVQLLKQIYTDYPESPDAASAEFTEAYTYANDLQDYDKGKQLYDAFLRNHPNHPLVSQIKLELKHLGKTPEEMIKEFEKNLEKK